MKKINEWTSTNQDPYYFIKSLEEGDYEAISIFITGDGGALVSFHRINIKDIPEDEFKEILSDIGLSGDIKIKYAVEAALTEGYGDEESLGYFEIDKIDEINKILKSKGIDYIFSAHDFN